MRGQLNMRRIDNRELHVVLERDSKGMVVRAIIGLGLWIACLYLLASTMNF
jgi:hypothetical protein